MRAGKLLDVLREIMGPGYPVANGGLHCLVGIGDLDKREFVGGGQKRGEFAAEPEQFAQVAVFAGEVGANGGELGEGVVAIGLQLADAVGERAGQVAGGLELRVEAHGVRGFIDADCGNHDDGGGEDFLECGHGDGFGCGRNRSCSGHLRKRGGGNGSRPAGRGKLDGVSRERGGKRDGRGGDSAAEEMATEFFDGARDAFLSGVLADAEGATDGAEILVIVKAEDDGVVIRFAEFGHDFVENGAELVPIRRAFGGRSEKFHGLESTGFLTELVTAGLTGNIAGSAAEPARERGVGGNAGGQFDGGLGEGNKDALGDIGGRIGRISLAGGGGKDEIGVAGDELGKGGFDAVQGVIAEELGVGFIEHHTY